MDVLARRLTELVDEKVVVVMLDGRAFLGTLREFDDRCLVLEDVVEGSTDNAHGWEEPTVGTGLAHKVVTWSGVFSHEDKDAEVVRLKDVLVQLQGVLRVWEWSEENTRRPEHVEVTRKQGAVVHHRGKEPGRGPDQG